MKDTIDRLFRVNTELLRMSWEAMDAGNSYLESRLLGKAEGVRLAISYIEEELR